MKNLNSTKRGEHEDPLPGSGWDLEHLHPAADPTVMTMWTLVKGGPSFDCGTRYLGAHILVAAVVM
jgi:hypothetical protein